MKLYWMQLFLTEFSVNGDNVIINDADIINQIRKVLRLKIGSIFQVQKIYKEKDTQEVIRLEVQIDRRDDKTIYVHKLKEEKKSLKTLLDKKSMLIAMPNKWQKAELIVQKLSEIGIQNIYFWPSERSVIKDQNMNKWTRLEKISKEAVEQSRGRISPKIEFVANISEIIENKEIVVFDLNLAGNASDKIVNEDNILGIIGPEGGFTDGDYKNFGSSLSIFGLGSSVLRMETAAIVGSWLLKNQH